MKFRSIIQLSILLLLTASGCGSLESGVIDTGFFNTGGTDDPRRLIGVAYNRMYKSNRIIGARNVLKRAIERSQKENDLYALAVSYNMMGYTYIQKEKDPNEAKKYYDKAIELIEHNEFDCELIHYYIGMALSEELLGIKDNSCSYEKKAQKTLTRIKYNFQNDVDGCEFGQKEIYIAEKRLSELSKHLSCK
ncbi:MAG: tetratricopeptide repeat protein [Desulfocapsaceae bacterium]|nr:tetratricopeptide repeat protein [Desulfocapsaceae bacterium]